MTFKLVSRTLEPQIGKNKLHKTKNQILRLLHCALETGRNDAQDNTGFSALDVDGGHKSNSIMYVLHASRC